MDFSKYKLQNYLIEGQAVERGAQSAITASTNSSNDARDGAARSAEEQTGNKGRQGRQNSQAVGTAQSSKTRFPESTEYNKQLIKEKEVIRAIESQKSDWRTELQEKVVDGQERQQHPYVTVMPTGDENVLQAVEQMFKTGKKKKESVTEEYQDLEEAKKKCKDGYKYDSEKKKCVKKKKKSSSKKSSTTIIVGRGFGRPIFGGGMHHHHHNDEDNSNGNGGNGNGNGGNGNGGGEGGGMGEMFDLLGDMLLQEKIEKSPRMKKMEAEYAAAAKKPSPFDNMTQKQKEQMTKATKPRQGSSD